MAYAELVSRSCFSFLDGASTPAALVEAAVSAGVTHLGIADRDGVYGLVEAHRAAAHHGLHLVLGATLTVEDHPAVVLHAEDAAGWRSLCRLITRSRAGRPKERAQLPLVAIAEGAEGLQCLLRPGWTPEAAAPLADAFGERLGVVLSRDLGPDDPARVRRALHTAKQLGARLVASNDVLFHHPSRRPLADVLRCIRYRTTLARAGRRLLPNAERHILDARAFEHRYGAWPHAIANARWFAERCSFSLDQLDYRYPREVVPPGYDAMGWLRALTARGLEQRYPDGIPPAVERQVEHELALIQKLDFPAYFLTVYDIVRFARDRGILCQGRGSAANSAVCYALGITAVDPARSHLLFERFISEERGEPPDIDVDFEHDRREEVIQYVYRRYGRHRAAMVNTVVRYRGRSALRDAGKVFGLSLDTLERLTRCTERRSALPGPDRLREAGLDPDHLAPVLNIAAQLVDLPRHVSIHVGGFVIADGAIVDQVPVEPAAMEGRTVIQWNKDDVAALRFVKVDLLGLGILSCIRRAFELIAHHTGQVWSLATVPPEDPSVYAMFRKADTLGVFQIESRAQMSMLPRLRPRTFYDLVIEVAIVRPGPIQGGMVHPYLRRRRGEEPVRYPHPSLRPILERTLGVPLFQEQVMAMAVAVGGFTPGEADELRRSMGAWRRRGDLETIGRKLVDGMIARGIEPTYAERIFEQIRGFGEYGFPESHAASFALLVYVSGWLKRHYPAAFAAALLDSQPMGFYSPRAIVADAERHGVEVRPVCVVHSCHGSTLEPHGEAFALRLGFGRLRGFGEAHGAAIVQAREEHPFRSLADFARRTGLDRGRLQTLAEAGAFAALGVDRREAAWILQGLWISSPLFAGRERPRPHPPLPRQGPFDRLRADYRTAGLSAGNHPLALLRPHLDGSFLPIDQLDTLADGASVQLVGLVAARQRPRTANGVVFIMIEDETGITNLVVRPAVWERHRAVARTSALLGIAGVLQRDGDATSVLVRRLWAPRWPEHPELAIRSRDFR